MTDNPTGPALFQEAAQHRDTFIAMQANTAALVMFAGLYADAHGIRSRELEVWTEVLPAPPLVECWGKEARRPECAERHTEDCAYADPVPEPKHVLLPVGTRVLVSERKYADEDYPQQPYVGIVKGYDMHRSKYQIRPEIFGEPGTYFEHVRWAFADNRVERHPEQNPTPPAPEPKPLVLYVQRFTGKQGRVLEMGSENGKVRVKVQWFAPGAEPVWVDLDVLKIIPAEEVERCPNGQTGDVCGSGENQCELCLADEDAEGDEIEESMGLR